MALFAVSIENSKTLKYHSYSENYHFFFFFIIFSNYNNESEKIFKEEESIAISKIIGLIKNI